ncbi:cysteate racemase [Halodesulfovibrio spirochaetisodalis]|uniref:Aspartate racemase n=1 Tax=Halodesulfovibrio spirochaetisodalis TaxID=1560234 RepID=A0A1B7XQA9_9BACT|nr:amino acid racemase [Halodesulfovibrio spirochaetisodalis]OBQ57683.1 hypothetical protein SP90_01250 [Halodesulfovibrio spirochaetisodalis]
MKNTTSEKVAGILGGMGPEATVDLLNRIIQLTPATDDNDHVRCIVDNNPKVPSRIKALVEKVGENPGPCMAEMAQRLEKWGADFLCIPCNTAHYYYDYANNAVSIPVVNLIDLTVARVLENNPNLTRVGILCSTAVISTQLYEKKFAEMNVTVLYPEDSFQEKLLEVIKRIKAGDTDSEVQALFATIVANVLEQGAELIIIACTELGIISTNLTFPSVDAAQILAEEIIARAKQV